MIATICLHPAIDRTLELSTPLEPGRLHRVSRVWERAGGKGVNVASVLSGLGAPTLAVLPVAGLNGARLEALLERQGIPHRALRVSGESRETQTIVDGGPHPTEVYESGPGLSSADLERFETLMPAEISWVIVSGSLPPGLEVSAFGAWLGQLSQRYRVAVDTSGAALRAALTAGVHLVKPNASELEGLGLTVREVFERFGVRVLYSLGADGLEYVGPEGQFAQAAIPVSVVNPVGAGDAALAGFVFAQTRGETIQHALQHAAACGAAACLEPVAGIVDPEKLAALLEPGGGVHA